MAHRPCVGADSHAGSRHDIGASLFQGAPAVAYALATAAHSSYAPALARLDSHVRILIRHRGGSCGGYMGGRGSGVPNPAGVFRSLGEDGAVDVHGVGGAAGGDCVGGGEGGAADGDEAGVVADQASDAGRGDLAGVEGAVDVLLAP